MIDVIFTVNGHDFSKSLSTYQITQEIKYSKVITTMDGTEHPIGETRRDIILFTLLPGLENDYEFYEAMMERPLIVEYSTKDRMVQKGEFRLDCNLNEIYLLKNCYGDIYYNGSQIKFRALGVY